MKEFIPIKKPHNNFVFTAPRDMDDCGDLNVTRYEGVIISVWKVPFLERLKFLIKGEVSLSIWSQGMPPVSLYMGDVVKDRK